MEDVQQHALSLLEPWLCASSGMPVLENVMDQRILMDKTIVQLMLNVDTDAYFYDTNSMIPTFRKVFHRFLRICDGIRMMGNEIQEVSATDLFTTEEVRGLAYYAETKSGIQKFAGSLQSWAYHIIINGTHPINREEIVRFVPVYVGPRTRSSIKPKDVQLNTNIFSNHPSSRIDPTTPIGSLGLPLCFEMSPKNHDFQYWLRRSLRNPKQVVCKPGSYFIVKLFEDIHGIPEDRRFSRLMIMQMIESENDDTSDE
jgi:hypothetical protein